MMYIKKFIDRVALLDSRPGKDLVMPANEAKMLRDEIAKILSDKVANMIDRPSEVIGENVVISGGRFK
jgi:hypothetical protein